MTTSNTEIPLLGSPKLRRQDPVKEEDILIPLPEKGSVKCRSREAILPRLANITEHSDELLLDLTSPDDIFAGSEVGSLEPSPPARSPIAEDVPTGIRSRPSSISRRRKPDERTPSVTTVESDRTPKMSTVEQTTKELPL